MYPEFDYENTINKEHQINEACLNMHQNDYEFPINDGNHKVTPDFVMMDRPDLNARRALMNLRRIAHNHDKVIRINRLTFTGVNNREVEIDYDIMNVKDFRKKILEGHTGARIDNWF